MTSTECHQSSPLNSLPASLSSSASQSLLILFVPAREKHHAGPNQFMAPSDHIDNFAKFPIELLVTIFGHLSRPDLLNVEAVSTRWRAIVRRHIWPIEQKMAFSNDGGPEFIRQFLIQRGQFLREVELDGFVEIGPFLPLINGFNRISISNLNAEQKETILAKLEENFG